MNANDDAIVKAVEEVSSVADELKRLRDNIKQYSDASQRLKDLGNNLEELNTSVGKIHNAFVSALEQVALTQAHAQSGKDSVDRLVNSVPGIIQRIEASDAAATARSVTDAMNSLGNLIRTHEKSLDDVSARLAAELASQATTLRSLHQRVDSGLEALGNLASEVHGLRSSTSEGTQLLRALNSAVCSDLSPRIESSQKSVSELGGLVDQLRKDAARSEESMTGHAGKALGELAILREQLDSAHKTLSEQSGAIQRQGVLLEEIAKRKKGWFS
ncbi:hypothetical protein LJR267_000031 [Paraburkholderia hospita]|uniref:hypothetical protein n=1 Tax=Paraburkholderia hospita TaxID=169430 RepID=UPI003ECE7C87